LKAIVQNGYGSPDVLELRDIDEPVVGDDQVLVRVRAASVHADVWHVTRGRPYVLRIMGAGLRTPKNLVPGTDLAGHVESVGTKVTRFRPGDEVFGQSLGANLWRNGGAFAEYAAVPEARLELKPANLTFEQAAAVPTSGPIAGQGLRDERRFRAGQTVLINGAGGGVGTFAVQLAKGTYVLIGHDRYGGAGHRWFGSLGRFAKLLVIAPFVSQLHPFRGAKDPRDRLVVLKELIEAGKVTPVIDRTFPLSEVPEAIRYLASGQALGKLIITIGP
jgi:NADPH:quinone reductase-like Zn-dependent oxidoreductase